MGSFTKTKTNKPGTAAGAGALQGGEKIKIAKDKYGNISTTSNFNSRDYLSSALHNDLDSRNQSTQKVKRNLNSISLIENIPLLKLMQSKPKKASELKIKSVSRSFSRRN